MFTVPLRSSYMDRIITEKRLETDLEETDLKDI